MFFLRQAYHFGLLESAKQGSPPIVEAVIDTDGSSEARAAAGIDDPADNAAGTRARGALALRLHSLCPRDHSARKPAAKRNHLDGLRYPWRSCPHDPGWLRLHLARTAAVPCAEGCRGLSHMALFRISRGAVRATLSLRHLVIGSGKVKISSADWFVRCLGT